MGTLSFDDQSVQASRGFKRFKGESGKTKRIFLLDQEAAHQKNHFVKGYSYFPCIKTTNGSCPACDKNLDLIDRFAIRILQYDTEINGDIKDPFNYEVMVYTFGPSAFADIRRIKQEWGEDIFKRDLLVDCENEQFQQNKLTLCKDSKLMLNPKAKEFAAEIKKQLAKIDLQKVVNPSIDAEKIEGILSGRVQRGKGSAAGSRGAGRSSGQTSHTTVSEKEASSLIDELAGKVDS